MHKKTRNRILIALIAIILILVCVLANVDIQQSVEPPAPVESEAETESEEESVPEEAEPTPEPGPDRYKTIALIGIDARENTLPDRANTDTMLIATINETTGKIRMVSIYRDTLLNIGSIKTEGLDVYDKANQAYANGGTEQLINMMQNNLDITIDEYMIVNFASVAKTVDAIGGINVWMTKQEVIHMNNYCVETSEVTGMSYTPIEPAEEAREYHLNGVQAVSYARIRYTAGNDMKRTQRQRVVIEKLVDRAKAKSFAALSSIVMDVLPTCKTSFSLFDIINYASRINDYEIEETGGFPTYYLGKNTYVNGKTIDPQIPVTLELSVIDLHALLYNDDDYEPSEQVREYSAYIEDFTGITEDDLELAKENSVIKDSGGEADVVR